jgi:hypothetical protein
MINRRIVIGNEFCNRPPLTERLSQWEFKAQWRERLKAAAPSGKTS